MGETDVRALPVTSRLRRALVAPLLAMALVALQAAPGGAVANPDLDTTFGGDGEVVTLFPGPSGASSVAFTSRGILVAGVASPSGAPAAIALARYRDDGSLDPTFGGDG